MIPGITAVDQIPMGITGKADFSKIHQIPRADAENGPEGPASDPAVGCDITGVIQRIWCETLGIATVSSADDFFSLGGDSVPMTRTSAWRLG